MRNRQKDSFPSSLPRPQSASGTIRAASPWQRLLAIENLIFTEWRLRFYGTGMLAAYVVMIAWAASRLPPNCVDFGRIWLSGVFAASGHPLGAYDYPVFAAAQRALFGKGCYLFHFVYPPSFLLFTYPFGLMPYRIAFAAWNFATLALYAAAVHAIVPRRTAVILAMTPFVVLINFDIGQNGCLTAALMGLSLICLERRAWQSGLWLGLMSYKPHLIVLFPIALVASRNWRSLAAAGLVAAVLAIAAAIAFGQDGWRLFFDSLLSRNAAALNADDSVQINLFSVYGVLRWAGASAWVSWSAQLAVAGALVPAICVLWARPIPGSLKAAAICAGSLIITPYVQYYDFCILPIAVAFLIREGLTRGFFPGERTALLMCVIGEFLLLLAPYMYSIIPFSTAIGIIFFFVARRAEVCVINANASSHPTLSAG
jgi:hypothetical protein